MGKNQLKNASTPRNVRAEFDPKSPSKSVSQMKTTKAKHSTQEVGSIKQTKDGSKKPVSMKLQKSFSPGKKDNKISSPPKPKLAKLASKKKTIRPIPSREDNSTAALDADVGNETAVIKVKRKAGSSSESGDRPKSKKQKLDAMTKKERKLERKKEKNNFELSMQAKKLWGTLRQAKCPKPKKLELAIELHGLIKGKIKELAVAHDTSRVIQSLVAHGSPEVKEAIYQELEADLNFMMKSVYANKIVMKFLKEGNKKHKEAIIKLMCGKVTLLMRHKIASKVVEYAYTDAATTSQKVNMIMEFYGPTYAIFKNDGVSSLDEILQRDPMQKDVVLNHLKETLSSFVEKSLIRHSIAHRVLSEYLVHCTVKDRTEMIESLRNYVVEILHTKDGASAAMQCVWHGTNKDRKIIIKSMKTHVAKICKEQYGHKVLLAIFDNVDDTKLVVEALLKEMVASLVDLCDDPNGRRVLIHILAPRKTAYFHPSEIDILKQGDGNATSKKDVAVRSKELHSFASPHLVKVITENIDKFARSSAHYSLVRAVATHATGASEVHEKLVEILNRPGNAKPPKIFDDPVAYHMLKQMIRADGEKFKEDQNGEVLFVNVLLKTMSDKEMAEWITSNRGTFALLMLLETEVPVVVKRVRDLLKPLKKQLLSKSFAGAQLLLKKLN